ncbi:ABC transporter family substrate-binding protein [Amycolatopsis magusensis]|uniref:Peptide/nickel transport system substrate-binding protein n=1 Tax=Amycolatopsis magusensis TaxID=882444 RepID=A0ABS4PH22_9PSEU|nr:ABC transporter family substrate-binding protein [Amycolatopsis magusensis]MBP2178710.1 peptide/nickel transport system substrate-binding protein [Amycolatopsis magusensis]MDI5974769.1 ABC transporter family substrate-binding protein [Amycolatopsis magusensis]
MRRSKAVSALSLVAGSALLLSACSGGGGNEGGDPNTGSSADIKSMATGKAQSGENFKLGAAANSDQVIVGIDQGFSAYNNDTPDSNSSYNTYVLTTVLSGADVLDGNNKVLLNNDVLESWTVTSKEPQIVEWKIKPGVKWSDGDAWDCDDFYLGWLSHSGKVKDGESPVFNSASSAGYSLVNEATCKDDLTFEAKFEKPYLDYKGMFNSTAMMPAHILEKQTGIADITKLTLSSPLEELKKAGDYWTNKFKDFDPATMPGSGPYKITAFDANQESVTLEKNPLWIGEKGGPAKIVVRAMKDTKAMATALQNGEIDVAASTQPDATAAGTMKGLAAQGVTYGSASQLTFEHLDLNFAKPIFQKQETRKAFFEVVNRQEIVDKLLKEVQADAQPLNSIVFYPGEQGYVDLYSDKAGKGAEAAAKTLTDAGWVKGADGIFAKDGQRFSVTITHNQNDRRKQTVEIIIAQAKAAGIEITDQTDPNFLKGNLDKGEYDIALFGWSSAPFKAEQPSIYIPKDQGGAQNYQSLNDPRIKTAFDKAVSATDETAGTQAYQEADKFIAENYATLPLFQTPSMWGFRGIDKVYMQSYNGALWNAGEWEKTS